MINKSSRRNSVGFCYFFLNILIFINCNYVFLICSGVLMFSSTGFNTLKVESRFVKIFLGVNCSSNNYSYYNLFSIIISIIIIHKISIIRPSIVFKTDYGLFHCRF